MNRGTIIRTIIAIIMLINQAFVTIGTIDFGNEVSNQIYKWASFIFLVAAYVASHWYNNDFTEVAAEKTGEMRQKKAELKAGYVGEQFFSDAEDAEDLGDEEEPVYGELGEALTEEDGDEDAHEDI